MSALENINIGIIGACGRGTSFRHACDALENVTIHAVCDINKEELEAARELAGRLDQSNSRDAES